jgi:hypothetical protein
MYEGNEGVHMVHFALKFAVSKDLQGKHVDLLQLLVAPVSTVKEKSIVLVSDFPPPPSKTGD